MKVILPGEDEIRRLYVGLYGKADHHNGLFMCGENPEKHVADYVECTIAEYHYWEDGEE